MQRIEAERARRRQEAGKKIDLKTNLSKGSTDEHVAAELGMSMTQWKKLRTIFERAKSGDTEAVELMKALDAGDAHRPRWKPSGRTTSRKRMIDTSPCGKGSTGCRKGSPRLHATGCTKKDASV